MALHGKHSSMKKLVALILTFLLPYQNAEAFLHHGGGISLSPFAPTIVHDFGDSITNGSLASPSSNRYITLLSTAYGTTLNNDGTSGAVACFNVRDNNPFVVASGTTVPSLTNNTLYTYFYGTNDVQFGATHQAPVILCHEASISWLATPITSKVLAQNCSQTGPWTFDTLPATGYGVTTTVSGSTLSCPITTDGGPLYVWYRETDGGTATFGCNLDATGSCKGITTVNAFIPAYNGTGAGHDGMLLLRLTGISAGSHTIVFTSNTSGQNIGFWGIGSPPITPYTDKMRTMVVNVLRQQNDANAAGTLAYANDVATVVTTLQGDNLPVTLVDARSLVNTTTDMADAVHPGNSGHAHIFNAFPSVFPLVFP